jgi:hypothetical protein
MTDQTTPAAHPDADQNKGVFEDDSSHPPGKASKSQVSMTGQLGHRNADELTNGSDSDFPEPGSSPEHSGQHK